MIIKNTRLKRPVRKNEKCGEQKRTKSVLRRMVAEVWLENVQYGVFTIAQSKT